MVKLLFSIWFAFHPVHVTLTSLDYIPETNELKVFVRMYYDDFLLDCKPGGSGSLNEKILKGNDLSRNVMEKYINEKLVITVNNRLLPGRLYDMVISDNEVSLNLVFNSSKRPETITVKNTIMTDLYEDQANMMIVKVADYEKGVKMTADLTEQTFIIN